MSNPTVMAGPTPMRPDAVRAYSGAGMQRGERKGSDNTLLLQQAASYAPLAQASVSSSAYGAETMPSTSYLPLINAKTIHSGEFVDHADLRDTLAGGAQSSVRRDSSSAVNEVYGDEVRHSAWHMAPRLSMSSAESSGGSEVKTPESLNAQPSWREEDLTKQVSNGECDAPVQRTVGSTSPALLDMSEAAREPNGLAASGFQKAEDVSRTSVNPSLIRAATSIDQEDVDSEESRDSIRRSVTIRAKRPDSLLKLPSTSYQTDRTITPSTSEPVTLQQDESLSLEGSIAHTVDQAYGKRQAEHSLGGSESSSDRFESPGLDSGDVYRFPSVHDERHSSWNSLQPSHAANPTAPLSPPERCAASPDSWRSLLPEHDPYYVRSEELADRDNRAGSDARAPSVTSASVKQAAEDARDGSHSIRRWSDNSRTSTFSLPGPIAVPADGSWSTPDSLYDLDGSFNSSGSRAAFATLQYGRNESSRSLVTPAVSASVSGGAGENLHREAMGKIADMVNEQQKRHASFSTFDNRNVHNRAAFHRIPFVHPDYLDDRKASARRTAGRSSLEVGASTALPQPPTNLKGTSGSRNGDSRENWPSSRNSLQPLPSPSMSDNPFAPSLKAERTEADGAVSNLASELQRRLPADLYDEPGWIADSPPMVSSPPSVVSTSMLESVLAGRDGGVTTTRTTTTTTTTTTTYTQQPGFSAPLSASSPNTRPYPLSEPGSNHGATDLLRQTSVKEAIKPYEVSPLSPPSLPFLDSRPAPASTDFGIETHASHYTLKTKLPGFSLEGITLATKHHCQLVIVADKWDESNGGHFERRITFGADADLKATRASFDGNLLKITVPRRRT